MIIYVNNIMIINDYLWSYIEIIDNHNIWRRYMGHINLDES